MFDIPKDFASDSFLPIFEVSPRQEEECEKKICSQRQGCLNHRRNKRPLKKYQGLTTNVKIRQIRV